MQGATTLSITIFSVTTFSIMTQHNDTQYNDTQHNDTQRNNTQQLFEELSIELSVIMFTVMACHGLHLATTCENTNNGI
jgi:hypothetical protein